MRILIPTILSTKHKVGVTEYLIGLLDALQEVDRINDYFIITTNENRHFFTLRNKNFHEIVVNIFDISRATLRLQYLLFSKFRIANLINKHKIDIIHEPCSWFINKKLNSVVTIHDIIELNSSKYSFLFNKLKQKMILSSIYNSNEIISVSNQTTNQIQKINDRTISTIYNGIKPLNRNGKIKDSLVLKKYNLQPKKYFIFVGTLLRHKNLITLLEAYKIFHQNMSNYKLVLAGKEGNAISKIKDYIKMNNLADRVTITGYFDDIEKSSLIENAIALVLVSKEEGFGFPILEAQSLGVPVITSNSSSLREISNSSSLLVDPNSAEAISLGMCDIIKNKKKVSQLIGLGHKNVRRFTWNSSALRTLEVYKQVYQNNLKN